MHDPTKVYMGSTESNIREVTNRAGTVPAGVACRLKSDGTLSLAKADGSLLGVSVGKSLSDIAWTSIARAGVKVPLKLTNGFTPVLGAQVHISDTTGLAAASGAGATGVNAHYSSAKLTCIEEDGTEFTDGCAYVDFIGGL
jgi:hypothetical protein